MVPLMPSLPLAITIVLLRFPIWQMQVRTRRSYTVAVVDADERSGAAGVTGMACIASGVGAAPITGMFLSAALGSRFFYLACAPKLIYNFCRFGGVVP